MIGTLNVFYRSKYLNVSGGRKYKKATHTISIYYYIMLIIKSEVGTL